jgi:hypothetical protein
MFHAYLMSRRLSHGRRRAMCSEWEVYRACYVASPVRGGRKVRSKAPDDERFVEQAALDEVSNRPAMGREGRKKGI